MQREIIEKKLEEESTEEDGKRERKRDGEKAEGGCQMERERVQQYIIRILNIKKIERVGRKWVK